MELKTLTVVLCLRWRLLHSNLFVPFVIELHKQTQAAAVDSQWVENSCAGKFVSMLRELRKALANQ
uniref:Uncharacterized protein n=1 Tax=Romanomermis culicivorax TaxID=13658 RepID=A0A915KJL6_ROMCU